MLDLLYFEEVLNLQLSFLNYLLRGFLEEVDPVVHFLFSLYEYLLHLGKPRKTLSRL